MKRGQKVIKVRWYLFTVILFGGVLLFLSWTNQCEEKVNVVSSDTINRFHSPPEIPDTVYFCNERVPLEYFDVYESLERELLIHMYWHSQTIWHIQKANRFFPEIEQILKDNNIPDDFKYLAVAESGLANVVSPAGAKGFWQIREGTAGDYGLEVNDEVDERYNLTKATGVACKFLGESYKKYNTWTLAAASYNVGRRGIERQIEKQGQNDYYDLLLNDETARYVFRIIAFKLLYENPEVYNFSVPEDKLYKPIACNIVSVDSTIENIAQFALDNNTNYKMLKILNPWLRDNKLTNSSGKTYKIKIPKNTTRLRN